MPAGVGCERGAARAPRYAWGVAICLSALLLLAGGVWLIATDAPSYRFLVGLFWDRHFLKHALRGWGRLAPVLFIALQALQVIVSPIPGDATGFLGGYVFGEWRGLFYSTMGLTVGSLAAFAVGRLLGARYVRGLVSQEAWDRLSFIVETQGAIVCLIVYLIPGLPKDIICYLFGISPIPFWVFAVASTLGRIPGTWALSAQGAHTASGDYLGTILLTAIVLAVALSLYCCRTRIVAWVRSRSLPPHRLGL